MTVLSVLKFGGSILRSEAHLPEAVHELYREVRAGGHVVAVVSALGDTTDRLRSSAHRVTSTPQPPGLAQLLATGEATSAALLAMALDRAGIPSVLMDAGRAGLRAAGPLLDSQPVDLDREAFRRAFEQAPVLVLPGFVGLGTDGHTALLGRGGSDLTALFVAHHLGADCCRLLKDKGGVYEADPDERPEARRFATLSWADAAALGGRVVQSKALAFARTQRRAFTIAAVSGATETLVGPCSTTLAAPGEPSPLRVALLGLGSVGWGVYRGLAARPDAFEVVGVAVRDPGRHAADDLPPGLLWGDAEALVRSAADVVVELTGGLNPAGKLVEAALAGGKAVVTANGRLLAARGPALETAAEAAGSVLCYSASVGGSAPALETVERVAATGRIRRLEAILSAPCGFVLDRLEEGSEFDDAVRAAQHRGLAGDDPTRDLDGTDSAERLTVLARRAFQDPQLPCRGERIGIVGIEHRHCEQAARQGRRIRLVASAERAEDQVALRVAPAWLPTDHPLAGVGSEQSRVLIETEAGERVWVSGKGAGRWPVAEAVLADLSDLWRARATRLQHPEGRLERAR